LLEPSAGGGGVAKLREQLGLPSREMVCSRDCVCGAIHARLFEG
jgi:hypothetical protein